MMRAFKYELFPTVSQEAQLAQIFGNVRFVYNWALKQRIKQYEQTKKSTSKYAQLKELTNLKHAKEHEWLNLAPAQSLQKAVDNVDAAFVSFFRRGFGFPNFKNKRSRQSFHIPEKTVIKFDFVKCTVKLPKLKEIRFYRDRKIAGEIRNATVSNTPIGRYFISVIVDDHQTPMLQAPTEKNTVGIDVGIKAYATLSDQTKVENPRFLSGALARLKAIQQKHSRKKKGSKRKEKSRKQIAKLHERIANQRKDFQHKTTTAIAKQWSFAAMEDLNIAGILKNKRLSRHIQDASWYSFKEKLSYKLENRGGKVIEIGRFEPSSKLCSNCGWLKEDLCLKDRNWVCQACNAQHDRDINAAINIKKFGLIKLASEDSEARLNKARLRSGSIDATV